MGPLRPTRVASLSAAESGDTLWWWSHREAPYDTIQSSTITMQCSKILTHLIGAAAALGQKVLLHLHLRRGVR